MPKSRLSPEALRAQRLAAGVSRVQAALAIGRSVETISQYESGRVAPPVDKLAELADAYDCPFAVFFEAVEPEPAP